MGVTSAVESAAGTPVPSTKYGVAADTPVHASVAAPSVKGLRAAAVKDAEKVPVVDMIAPVPAVAMLSAIAAGCATAVTETGFAPVPSTK